MRKLLPLAFTLLFATNLFAQAPQKISFQAVIRNNSNNLVANTLVGMRISILQGSATGTVVYRERQTPTTNANGLASIQIGGGTVLLGSFSTINWSSGTYFIKTETDTAGGTAYSITSTTQLLSVPYALYSQTSGNGIQPGTSPGQMNYWNGTSWVAIAPGAQSQGLYFCNGVPIWGPCLAVLTTSAVSSITNLSAICGGNIISDNGATIIKRGVCWSTTPNPVGSNLTNDGTGTGTYSSSITGLTASTTYYVRAYAQNNIGQVAYGNELSFTTSAATLPILTTTAVTAITSISITTGGSITSDGGTPVTARGICWSTTTNPNITGNHTTDGSGTGSFISIISGLTPFTTYYFRAYATNSVGTKYGSQKSFTTGAPPAPPVLTTNIVTSVGITTATSGGNITSDGGGGSIAGRGVCWSLLPNPIVAAGKTTSNGSGMGSFTSNITGLFAGTTYYLRAYAYNSIGTGYGNELSFTTSPATPPSLTTSPVTTSLSTTNATSGGTISSDNGTQVTARGVCWSTSSNPTVTGNHTTDGSGTGSFTSTLTGLMPNTVYYVRAYGTNNAGTSYGNEISFTSSNPIFTIGQSYQGGKIAYIDSTGLHGLIAATSDQSVGIQWYNGINVVTGATATAIGTGNLNTVTIVAAQGPGSYAAKLCSDLVLGGYSDWYLPSGNELVQLYINRVAIGGFAISTGGETTYWSSTESFPNNTLAIKVVFEGIFAGQLGNDSKYTPSYVRAVRSF